MRVIHVALGKANPDRMNGINRIVHNLATYQWRAGNDVEVWGITPTPDDPTFEREYRLRLFQARGIHRALVPDLRLALSTLDARAVVHLHGGLVPDFYRVARILRKCGQRYLITPHGAFNAEALRKRGWAKRLYLATFERSLVDGALVIHCGGPSEYDNTARLFPGARRIVVPNGIALAEVEFRDRPVEVRARPLFGYCGRMDMRHKGLDLLIDGFLRYRRGRGEGELWMIGNGPDLQELKRRVEEAGETESVVFWGERHGEEKLSLLFRLDVFFHPSRFEGFPMSVLEAAALGKCLVVSDRTNIEEYVERYDAGVILRQGTAEEIADTCMIAQDFYATGDCSRKGANSLRMVEEELSWDQVSGQILAVYEHIAMDSVIAS
jgi:glycosyltransferase involved in cell wall biosynthesis